MGLEEGPWKPWPSNRQKSYKPCDCLMDALCRSVAAEKAAEPTAPVLDAEPKPAITSKDRKARKKAETPAPDTTASEPKKPRRARRSM